ncbi:MAG: glycosyltransferase family 4 protein [Bacteroidetes bacterium]|nr:glycosyltransferase family 4 protein [Bacteroidota bacterium]
MRILFLCNKSPWPPKEGGPMAMNMLIEGMLEAGHSVKVLAVNSYKYNIKTGDIPSVYMEQTGIEFIDVDLRVKTLPALANLFTSRSYHAERFKSEAFTAKLIEVLREAEYDIVQLETLMMAPYIQVIRNNSKAKIILRAHNIEHLIWERLAANSSNRLRRLYINHLARTLKLFELTIPDLVDGVVAISGKDAEFFRSHTEKPVISIPFGINPADYHVKEKVNRHPTIFIIGAMNWIPNQEGVRWFLENVWIDLYKRYPSLKFHIAGREMPEWMKKLSLENIVVEGEVDDAAGFYAANDIMIVPLFSGSGIRIKIIEAMAYGKTVISTSLGAEGIEYSRGENLLVADLACEFFEMISVCIEHPEVMERTGSNARRLAETVYDRKKIIEKLQRFYTKLTS